MSRDDPFETAQLNALNDKEILAQVFLPLNNNPSSGLPNAKEPPKRKSFFWISHENTSTLVATLN